MLLPRLDRRDCGYTGTMKRSSFLAAAALVMAFLVSTAGAAGLQTGSVVVRLVTDPSPPGVSWSYSGLGAPVQLGISGTERAVQGLQPGTYHLLEAAVDPAQARTLTGIACSDPSRDTTVDLGGSAAAITLAANETVTCTFTH